MVSEGRRGGGQGREGPARGPIMGSVLRHSACAGHGSRPCRMSLIRQTLRIYRLLTDREIERSGRRDWHRMTTRTAVRIGLGIGLSIERSG